MSTLDGTAEHRRRLAQLATAFSLARFEDPGSRAVQKPADPAALVELLSEPLPKEGADAEVIVRDVEERILPYCRDNGHPRMFGYVSSSGTFAGAAADFMASALNQNVTSWRSAPAPTEVERLVVRWIAEVVGFPASSAGLLLSGGSMANFSAVAAALHAAAEREGVDLARQGVRALAREPVVYASEMTHMSIAKACEMLGLGAAAAKSLPTRDDFTLDVEALEAAIEEDARAGRMPFCAVANAGDVNTGAIDPIAAMADVCARHGVWLHADAAYGGFATLAAEGKRRLSELAKADSVALDPHKWLYVPLDAGCLLVRDPAALPRAFSHGADYIEVLEGSDRAGFAFWDYGPELSRRFRALKVWMQFKAYGTSALGEAVARNLEVAKRLADLVDAAPDFERLAPVPLSIVCFRHVPDELRGDAEALNAHNRALVAAIQRSGDAYVSNAMLRGSFALRACIVNHRTRAQDADALLDIVRREASALRA